VGGGDVWLARCRGGGDGCNGGWKIMRGETVKVRRRGWERRCTWYGTMVACPVTPQEHGRGTIEGGRYYFLYQAAI
jgi:hypothetical protein